jgi:hypothetical protein
VLLASKPSGAGLTRLRRCDGAGELPQICGSDNSDVRADVSPARKEKGFFTHKRTLSYHSGECSRTDSPPTFASPLTAQWPKRLCSTEHRLHLPFHTATAQPRKEQQDLEGLASFLVRGSVSPFRRGSGFAYPVFSFSSRKRKDGVNPRKEKGFFTCRGHSPPPPRRK